MIKSLFFIFCRVCSLFLAGSTFCVAATLPFVVDDRGGSVDFEVIMDKAIATGQVPTGNKLIQQAKEVEGQKIELESKKSKLSTSFDYEKQKMAVAVVCSVYKCDKCDAWHRGGVSSGWVIGQDGLLMTNYHVLINAVGQSGLGVWLADGSVYPVESVVSADKNADIVCLRLKVPEGKKLETLTLALEPASVGSPIFIISHPDGFSYLLTQGIISRYYKRPLSKRNEEVRDKKEEEGSALNQAEPPRTTNEHRPMVMKSEQMQLWMHVSADFAKGSSGAPVLDGRGRVVGMVASSQALYTSENRNALSEGASMPLYQMSLRSCVPWQSLKALMAK